MGLVTGAFCVAELVSSLERRGVRKLVSAWQDMLASLLGFGLSMQR